MSREDQHSGNPGSPNPAPSRSPDRGMDRNPDHGVHRILAIDGPAGAGKSTVAASMAARFGLLNIETGAMYRAFALRALTEGVSLEDPSALARLLAHTAIELRPAPGGNRVLLDGAEVTDELRTARVSDAASRVSVHAPVRASLVRLQQARGRAPLPPDTHGLVMEGRDIGTVVFPEAGLKIFLFASPEARTERRLAQTPGALTIAPTVENAPASPAALAAALADLEERDRRDSTRVESPLRPADDAVVLDSTHLTLAEVVERVAALVGERWQLSPIGPRSL